MERRLLLMRHAKSSWKTDAPTDHDRPLNKRGRRDSPKVAAEIQRLGWTPDYVLSSDAARTAETLELMRKKLGFNGDGDLRSDLYHAGIDELREALRELSDDTKTVLVLGHNPGWEEAVEWLAGEATVMKTAYVALLSIHAESWAEGVDQGGAWTLHDMIRPKEL